MAVQGHFTLPSESCQSACPDCTGRLVTSVHVGWPGLLHGSARRARRRGIGPRKCEAAWFEVLVPFFKTVAHEHEYARRWWPIGGDRRVVIDPDYGYGLPVIQGSGVRTEIVYEQVQALESQERIAYSFNITLEEVEHAIQFEASRTPA